MASATPPTPSSHTAAVVLSGCGFLDGSEIHEAVSCLIHLARHGIAAHCFAPDIAQAGTMDHATHKPAAETRNCLVESARITRGKILPIKELHADRFDLLVFPGGFGAAKNLCAFAKDGANCAVNADVERVIREFHAKGKTIAMCCIAPVIAARVLGTARGGRGCAVTIGTDDATAGAIRAMGASHADTRVTEAHVDRANRLVTTGAYMFDATPWEIYQGVGAMIDRAADLLSTRA
jgi:enhancing lycopene biosynthesis protein 2